LEIAFALEASLRRGHRRVARREALVVGQAPRVAIGEAARVELRDVRDVLRAHPLVHLALDRLVLPHEVAATVAALVRELSVERRERREIERGYAGEL